MRHKLKPWLMAVALVGAYAAASSLGAILTGGI